MMNSIDTLPVTETATDTAQTLKGKARQIQQAATESIQNAVEAADDYAHENPWIVLGSFAAAGLLLGILIGMRGRR